VIFRSDKPEAVKFQDWVFNEVLPALRKNGKYDIGQPQPPESETINKTQFINKDTDKYGFHILKSPFFKLRYLIEEEALLISLDDIDNFLEVTRLDGINQERNENNYTIHHILWDCNLTPKCKIMTINSERFGFDFLNPSQLMELCHNLKTKRSEILLNYLEREMANLTPSEREITSLIPSEDKPTNLLEANMKTIRQTF
jgi:hypothetical protein